MKKLICCLGLVCIILCTGCSSSDDSIPNNPNPLPPILSEEIEVYESSLLHNNLTLIVENGSNESYLINKTGERLFTWDFEDKLGNDFELFPNGKSLGIFKSENSSFGFGGKGGKIKIINPDSSIDWEYEYNTTKNISHHDVEWLPNGNVLFLAWEKIDVTQAQQLGIITTDDIFPEKLVEVNPITNEIVWEWNSWDHSVQDTNSNLPNFDSVSLNPQRIDFSYNISESSGDIMHANGIDYDASKDVIYISVNYYNEVWVIDHSTSTAEASSVSGGNYNKGGDLLYRFGNPLTYKNNEGSILFDRNHFPNLIEDNVPGTGNMLIYVNGASVQQSTVYELVMPDMFNMIPNTDNEPQINWSYTHEDLGFDKISGAVRLSNGNTLITEGDYGLWEITPSKEIAWKYKSLEGNIWRAYDYDLDHPALPLLGLDF